MNPALLSTTKHKRSYQITFTTAGISGHFARMSPKAENSFLLQVFDCCLSRDRCNLTSSQAGLSRYLVGHQCRQFVAVSSSLPAPHLPASSAHTPWLTAVLPAHSQYPAKPESRTFSTLTPSKTRKFHIHKKWSCQCCIASAALVILPVHDYQSISQNKSTPIPRRDLEGQ